MLERKAVLDPGGWSFKLYDTRSRKTFQIRSCLYEDENGAITGTDALQAYWEKGKSRITYPLSQGKMLLDVRRLFSDLTDQTHLFSRLLKPKALVVLPQDVLEEERSGWIDLCTQSGFRKVAFASTMDLLKVDCGLVIHAGYSCTEMAMYCSGRQLAWKKLIYGGQQMDEKIIDEIAGKYKALIFNEDAAVLKERASTAFWQNRNPRMECTVLDYTSEYMRLELPCLDVWPPMESILSQIVLWAKDLSVSHGADLAQSVLSYPVQLSGGLAKCFGLKQMLEEQLGAQVQVEDHPETVLLRKGAKYS